MDILSYIWDWTVLFFKAVWNFVVSIFSSLREILVTGFVLFGFFVLANMSAEWAKSDAIGLLALASLFSGLAKFCAISLTVFVVGIAVSFPNTIGKFVSNGFEEAWKALPEEKKLTVTLWVAGVLGLIATICFVF